MFALRQLQKVSSVSRQSRRVTSFASRLPCLSVVAGDGKLVDTNNKAASVKADVGRPKQFSTFSMSSPPIPKIYPQYNVHGDTCMMSVKIRTPTFRLVRGEYLVAEKAKLARLFLEFTPRGSEGKYEWHEKISFGLSPEEVGLVISQLPEASVELSRKLFPREKPNDDSFYGDGAQTTSDLPDKVLRVEPGQAATVKFSVDYVKEGIGGQAPGPGQEGKAPLDIIVQAGEFKVISKLMEESIPYLVGWTNLVELSMRKSVDDALRYGGDGSSGGKVPL